MVKLFFYREQQELDQIPETFYDFKNIVQALYDLEGVEQLSFEYTSDDKHFFILNDENYEKFFLGGTKNTKVYVFFTQEETHYFQNKNKEDEKIVEKKNFKIEEESDEKIEEIEKEDKKKNINNINNDNYINTNDENNNKIIINDEKDNDTEGIKVPEITKDMVIASIVKQVKERMQQSRILLKEKEKKEEEERKRKELEEKERKEKEKEQNKGISEQINNLITNRLDNLKEELINESQIKFSEIISESQINLQNAFENNNIIETEDENKESIHSLEQHPGITCVNCGMSPIIGNRYCCVYCSNVNYCEKCEEQNGLKHGHPLYKLKLRI